ncbi:Scr1 family TA system antitoxin-like transcriptional regulator [Streptomyces chrestomyceticus]|uniref:Scr1 family TA system antitoxin-like transcriptional regulator n=1 Tax=Streptomyces chrestomyceticus TaxID=68185 RepID=UPI0036CD0D6E
MTTNPVPAPAAHLLLGAYLRALCATNAVDVDHLAGCLGRDSDWITEPGSQPGPPPEQFTALLSLLGVTPSAINSARALLTPSPHPHRLIDAAPGWAARLAACEHAAHTLRICAPLTVPGIVQTPADAEALATALPQHAIEAGPSASRLPPPDHPQHITLVLNEAVLLTEVGGPDVMAERTCILQQLADDGRLDLRILPQHRGLLPRSLREMTLPPHGHHLYADGDQGPLYVSGPPAACASLRQILDNAISVAAGPEDSRRLLQKHRQHYEEQRLRQMLPGSPTTDR